MIGGKNTLKALCALGACLLMGTAQASAQTPVLIGVDFDNGAGSPANWNTMSGGGALVNVIDEMGAATGVDFSLSSATPFTTAASSATIPMHWNTLDPGIGDYVYNTGIGVATFENLTPGQDYYFWVFGLRGFTMNNRVTVLGGGAPIQFDQLSTAGQMWVNDQLGSNANPLASYAMVQSATAAGTLTFEFDIVPGGGAGWTIGGLAISAVPAPGTAGLLALTGVCAIRRRR